MRDTGTKNKPLRLFITSREYCLHARGHADARKKEFTRVSLTELADSLINRFLSVSYFLSIFYIFILKWND
jgi:hypothetical protein